MSAVARSRTGNGPLSRAGYGLAAAAVGATIFVPAPRTDAVRFVDVPLRVVAVLLVIAALGVVGARTGNPLALAGAAVIGLGASVLQFVELGLSTDVLGGNGSTAGFLAALGVGFAGLRYASRHAAATDRNSGTAQE